MASPIVDSLNFLACEWSALWEKPFIKANLSAGLTVAAVALPLNLALAIAAGLPPSAGIIAGAVGGGLAALFGGSRFQATGPAAAINLMVFVLVQKFGAPGAAAAAILVGGITLILSSLSAGSLIRFVPESVLIGFTTGVGLKLLDVQLPKLFGIEWDVYAMVESVMKPVWLHEVTWPAVVCGLFVILFVVACRPFPKFPAALVSIGIATQLAVYLDWPIHRVGEIPPLSLQFSWPHFDMKDWVTLLQLALPLGLLAAAESLLSAQAVDRLSGDRHHSNLELFGQGLANLGAGLFGGMPVSGVVVRSTVNIQSGGKNRLAALFHALFLLASAFLIGGVLSKVPIAALAGLLCIIGFRLIEFSNFVHLLKTSKIESLAFLAAMAGTVSGHIASGLVVGLLLVGAREVLKRKPKKSAFEKTDKNEFLNSSLSPQASVPSSAVYKILDQGEKWIQHLKASSHIPATAYVHPNASVIGRVILGRNVHVAAEACIRADEGTPFYIGDDTNIQDGVVIHALKKKWIRVRNENWAVYIGKEVSLAHQALVHGPCLIGDRTFVGFKAVVHDSIVESGCYIGIGAIVVGVHIPENRYVPHGAIVDSEEKVRQLPKVSESHRHFNEDVVEVNKGLAEAYRELEIQKV